MGAVSEIASLVAALTSTLTLLLSEVRRRHMEGDSVSREELRQALLT